MNAIEPTIIYTFLNDEFLTGYSFIASAATIKGEPIYSRIVRNEREAEFFLGVEGGFKPIHDMYKKRFPEGYEVKAIKWRDTLYDRTLAEILYNHKRKAWIN